LNRCFDGIKGEDMEVLSVQADDHQEQPFQVGPLLPEQIIGDFNMGQRLRTA
jgi:hypothetical protein